VVARTEYGASSRCLISRGTLRDQRRLPWRSYSAAEPRRVRTLIDA